ELRGAQGELAGLLLGALAGFLHLALRELPFRDVLDGAIEVHGAGIGVVPYADAVIEHPADVPGSGDDTYGAGVRSPVGPGALLIALPGQRDVVRMDQTEEAAARLRLFEGVAGHVRERVRHPVEDHFPVRHLPVAVRPVRREGADRPPARLGAAHGGLGALAIADVAEHALHDAAAAEPGHAGADLDRDRPALGVPDAHVAGGQAAVAHAAGHQLAVGLRLL